jgi:hypothetical protein
MHGHVRCVRVCSVLGQPHVFTYVYRTDTGSVASNEILVESSCNVKYINMFRIGKIAKLATTTSRFLAGACRSWVQIPAECTFLLFMWNF